MDTNTTFGCDGVVAEATPVLFGLNRSKERKNDSSEFLRRFRLVNPDPHSRVPSWVVFDEIGEMLFGGGGSRNSTANSAASLHCGGCWTGHHNFVDENEEKIAKGSGWNDWPPLECTDYDTEASELGTRENCSGDEGEKG